jgi:nucleoside-diphosphate kinase
MLQLSRQNALEFFEVYRGVVPEYLGWVEEVSCGKCVVLQCVYRDDPASSVEALRMLCGAHDPAVAASVEPDSIRALFGESRVKNAVHCSDLTEDGPSEVHYFFP